MARKRSKELADADKAVIYAEVPVWLRDRMHELAREHDRKLTGEVIVALKEYVAKFDKEKA